MRSLIGPSGMKLATLKKLAFLLSFGPLSVTTVYLKSSCPELVACNSGVSARRPIIVIFANELRAEEVEKARAAAGARMERRRKEDILRVVLECASDRESC